MTDRPKVEVDVAVLAWIASRADGGCSNCAHGIAADLADYYPEHDWTALINAEFNKSYEERFDEYDELRRPEPLAKSTSSASPSTAKGDGR